MWRRNEKDYLRIAADELRKTDPNGRPVWMYDPNHRTSDGLVATGADKSLLVSFIQWKSDTYVNVALLYDASAEVFDGKGQSLARKNVSGRDDLGGDVVYPMGHAEKAVPERTRKIFELLLNDEEIVKALQ